MSSTIPTSLNGRMKKTLAFQLDRLDSILDGLAEALNGAVAEAVKETVGQAARDAVKVALDEAMAQAAIAKPRPVVKPQTAPGSLGRFWCKAQAKVRSVISQVKGLAVSVYQQVKQFGAQTMCATVLAAQSCIAKVKTRSMRWGMMLGTLVTCVVSLFRRESRIFWWSAGIGFGVILLESVLGTLGTLMLGGALIYFTAHAQGDRERATLQIA
ncbi:MAG TPA: hypothetical protein PLX97_15330 [Gemmatales bacterium]|nr:hypothetical protein [Gemmatales bacterium]